MGVGRVGDWMHGHWADRPVLSFVFYMVVVWGILGLAVWVDGLVRQP